MLTSSQRRRLWIPTAGVIIALAAGLPFLSRKGTAHRERTYRIGAQNDPPYQVVGPDGRVTGLGVDVLAAAAQRAGIRLQWIHMPEGPDAALRSGKVDLWPMFTVSRERLAYAHITEPWYTNGHCLISNGLLPGDFARRTISCASIPINVSEVGELYPAARRLVKATQADSIEAVCSGEAVAAFANLRTLSTILLHRPAGCETAVFHLTPVNDTPGKVGIGSTFECARVADQLRQRITDCAADGTLAALFSKWDLFSISESDNAFKLADARRRSSLLGFVAVVSVAALLVVAWQIRRTRQARRAADRANSAKSQFLASMSHEIRTPLNGVVGMTELLARSDLSAGQREMVEIVEASAETLLLLVNDVLDFSKIEAGEMRIEHTAFRPRTVVRDVVELVRPRASAKGLEVETAIADGVPETVLGDPLRVRQILFNLVGNAIKFTPAGKVKVEVDARDAAGAGCTLVFRVIDTGIGIAREVQGKLFAPFTQADSATARKYGGTGLGLAISHRLVRLMQGSIGIESEPGRGSTFRFEIPASAVRTAGTLPAAEEDGPVALPAPGSVKGHVLVTDDNAVNRLVALRMVRQLGYAASAVADGCDAVAAVDKGGIDLILMDCQMPGMNGFQATAEIRRRESGARRIPIVAMTANAMEGDDKECLAAGMDGYLSKPIRMATLARTLESWLCDAGAAAPQRP